MSHRLKDADKPVCMGAKCKVRGKVQFCRIEDISHCIDNIFPFQRHIIQQRKRCSFLKINHTATNYLFLSKNKSYGNENTAKCGLHNRAICKIVPRAKYVRKSSR